MVTKVCPIVREKSGIICKSFYSFLAGLTMIYRCSTPCFARVASGSARSELKKVERQIDYYNKRHNARVKDINRSRDIGLNLKKNFNRLESKVAEVSERVSKVKSSIAQNEEEIKKAELELAKCYEDLREVLNKMYKSGEGGYGLDVFFETETPSDVDDDICIVYASLAQWGKLIVEEINHTKKNLELSKSQLEENKKSLSSLRNELDDQKNSVKREQEVNDSLMSSLYKEEKIEKAKLDLLEMRKRKLEAQLREIQIRHNKKSTLKRGSGRYSWPVNGPLTSPFGRRWGRMHNGIDVGVSTGTPVHAAAPGNVITVGFDRYGWGNYVMIDHGSGYATLYAHLSRAAVGPGQHVDSAQVIGFSGSTGRSTGPHVHFETWKNGTRYNPLSELG